MNNMKNEPGQSHKKTFTYQLSKNIYWHLTAHALIGLTVGFIIGEIRDVQTAPVLCSTATTLWGWLIYRRSVGK